MNTIHSIKYLLSVLLLSFAIHGTQAQATYICNEKFSTRFPSGWNVAPVPSAANPAWVTDTGTALSGKYAAHGKVPVKAGDTAELVTPFFDCSAYAHVLLRFSHICKVLPCDICQIQYQEQGLGAHYQWKPIPKDAYRGYSADYGTRLGFDHTSYSDWRAGDTGAIPSGSWYKEETFDLSNCASYSKVRFRFLIRKGSYTGSYVADGWWVEDVQLSGSAREIRPPAVAFTSSLPDTATSTGPFAVHAKVATRTSGRILQPYLHVLSTYSKSTRHDSLKMQATAGDSLWTAALPQYRFGTDIHYYIIGRDSLGNSARANAGMHLKYPGGYDSSAVAMLSIDSPGKISIGNPQHVRVTFKNKGLRNLTSAVLHWSLNGVYQGSRNYSGDLPCDFNDTLTLGSYFHRFGTYDTVCAWIRLPGNASDSNTADDSLTRCSLGCVSAAAGTYTVGPGGNYRTLDDAMNGIRACGVSGDITLAFESGTYSMTKSFSVNTVFMDGHHLTLTSLAQNRDSVIFNFNVSNGAVLLDSAYHVTFSHISLHNANSSGHTVAFTGTAEHIDFLHCGLRITSAGTAGNNGCLGKGDRNVITSACRNIRFIGNAIEGGCRNWISGTESNRLTDIRMDSNRITGTYDGALVICHADRVNVSYNTVIPRAGVTSWNASGIQLTDVTGDSVCGNSVNFSQVTTANFGAPALLISGDSSCRQRMLIANNVLIGHNNAGNGNGISKTVALSSLKCDFVHNSIYNGNTSKSPASAYTTHGIFVLYLDGAGSDVRCIGNQIITHDGQNQYALWADPAISAQGKFQSDYNNYSCNGTVLAYFNGKAVADLNALRAVTKGDTHSLNLPVRFTDSTRNLALESYLPFLMPNIGIANDCENTARDRQTSMGAYTLILKDNDAALKDFAGTEIRSGKSCDVCVRLANPGLDTLTSACIRWSAGNVLQAPYLWSGRLVPNACDTVKIGSITPKGNGSFKLTAWVESPNGKKDEYHGNDTVRFAKFLCSSPITCDVSIGPDGDFATFGQALEALNDCGIGAPVRILASTANWGQTVIRGKVKGADSLNTLTLMPDSGAALSVDGGTGVSLTLDGASFWHFENMSIGNTSNGGTGVEMKGQNRDILFRNCRICASSSTSVNTSHCVSMSGSTTDTTYPVNVRFVRNTLKGGYYNFNFQYASGAPAQLALSSVHVDSNILEDAYFGALYAINTAVRTYSHNRIANRAGSSSAFYGLRADSYGCWESIEGNRIRLSNTGASYGLYMGSNSQNAAYNGGQLCRICNNEIILDCSKGSNFGMYIVSANGFVDLHHNSVWSKTTGACYGLYLSNTSTSCKLNASRNLVYCEGTSKTLYPLYITSATYSKNTYGIRSCNNFYSAANVAYAGGAKTSVSALQAASGQDSSTISLTPRFHDLTKGLQLKSDTGFLCPADPQTPSDITGTLRASGTAMGCYDAAVFLPMPDLRLSRILSPDTGSSIGVPVPLTLELTNTGNVPVTSASIHCILNGTSGNTFAWKGHLDKGRKDTVTAGQITFIQGNNSLCVFIDKVNDSADVHPENDTLYLYRSTCTGTPDSVFVIGRSAKADCSFARLDSLFSLLAACGNGSNVTLKFENGIYSLGSAPIQWNTDFMKGGHLTVTSLSGNSDSVVFQGSKGAVNLNGMRNVCFDRVTLDNTGNTAHTVNFTGTAENICFRHCRMLVSGSGTSGSNGCIGYNDKGSISALTRNIRFIGNRLQGGCRNYLSGSSTHRLSGIRMDSNVITGTADGALYIGYADSVSCSHNFIRPQPATASWSCGIQLDHVTADSVYGNRIAFDSVSQIRFGGNAFAISGTGNGGSRMLIADNVAVGKNTAAYANGYGAVMDLNNVKADVLFNSLYNDAAAITGSTAGICLLNLSGSNTDVTVYGNQFVTSDSSLQFPVRADADAVKGHIFMDGNNYATRGTQLAEWNGKAVLSLNALQALSKGDTHSVCLLPSFTDISEGLELDSYFSFLIPSRNVSGDIRDSVRGNITSMGAYTAMLKKLDAALTGFAQTMLLGGKDCPVSVSLQNQGYDTLTSAEIAWSVNGVAQPPVEWNGDLVPGAQTEVILGNITPKAGGRTGIVARVYAPNTGTDMNLRNDTVRMSQFICGGKFSGSYTVGGTHPDFSDFGEAAAALNSCGISGPVNLKFRSGTYPAIKAGTISGTSDSVRITVMPDSAAKVTFDGGSKEAGILLSDAAYWVFRGIHAGNTADGIYGVKMEGSNHDITFRDCGIYASDTASATAAAVCFANSDRSSNYPYRVRFIHNDIAGGACNVYMHYMSGSENGISASSVTLDSNTLSDACAFGIYSHYYAHYASISCNRIVSRKGASDYTGIFLNYYNTVDTLQGNRIRVECSREGCGMYLYYYVNDVRYAGKTGLAANNEIMVTAGTSATGLHLNYPYQHWKIYHNSIRSVSAKGTAYGLYLYNSNGSYLIHVRNNIVVTDGAASYPMYVYKDAAYSGRNYMRSDCNGFYSPTAMGCAGSTIHATLADWQKATKQDSSSTFMLPPFSDVSRSLELKDYSLFSCSRLAEVPLDITQDARLPNTAKGCYGKPLSNDLDLKAEAFVSPAGIQGVKCFGDFTDVTVRIANNSRTDADFGRSPMSMHLEVSGAVSFSKDTLITAGRLTADSSATFRLCSLPTGTSGIYNLKVTIRHASDLHPENDTLSMAYDARRIGLPYETDFSVLPPECLLSASSGNAGWNISQDGKPLRPVFGSGLLRFGSKGQSASVGSAVFNAVDIAGTSHPRLSLWFAHTDENVREYLSVQITTDGGATYAELGKIAAADTGNCWKQYDFDLSRFTGYDCVSLLFQAVSYGGCDLAIDRIRITADMDVDIRLLPADLSALSACDPTPVDVKAVIRNLTGLNTELRNDTLSLKVSGAAVYSRQVVYSRRLDGYASDTVLLGQLSLNTNGRYCMEAWMQSADDHAANDTVRDSTLYILQDISLDSITGMDRQRICTAGETVGISAFAVNTGNIPVERVLFRMELDGNEVVTDTVFRPLKPGDTLFHTLSRPYTVPAVSKDQPFYFLEVKAVLDCDGDSTDNAIQIIGKVNVPDTIDVQVVDILVSDTMGKTQVRPCVRIANTGNADATDVMLHLMLTDSSDLPVLQLHEHIGLIGSNDTAERCFSAAYTVPNYTGKYTLTAYIEACDGDGNPGNDTLSRQFDCRLNDVVIREGRRTDWSMGQNIPNPACRITRIPFSLPQDANVVFSVMSANGQLVYREVLSATAGSNTVDFNVSNLANGVYCYSMECNGRRTVRKMTVAH